MLSARHKSHNSQARRMATAPLGRPGDRSTSYVAKIMRTDASTSRNDIGDEAHLSATGFHPLTKRQDNAQLQGYESGVKAAFDAIDPAMKEISALSGHVDFQTRAKELISSRLGLGLPQTLFSDLTAGGMDIRRLYAWCLFETYQKYCNSFLHDFPYCMSDNEFQDFLHECGFHALDVSPCSDGRLAHVVSYVLRLPYRSVRRKSYAGAMFDIEDNIEKWVETEFLRFREGKPNTADAPTRYLKTVVYHYSSIDPGYEGCAAHGSDSRMAAKAGMDRLIAFKQAIENTFCCGASIDYLLIGLDTDTDAICIHPADANDRINLDKCINAREIYDATKSMDYRQARNMVSDIVKAASPGMPEGMENLVTYLLINNISQIDYVRMYHGEHYEDIGHAEHFIGAGIGFEEVQLRNLTYFAYLNTVEEAANDLDVGIKIFTRLNVSRGLPVPVVVRYDYHNNVPGARERAIQHCQRVADALNSRYKDLVSQGLLHTLLVIRDIDTYNDSIEVLACSAAACAAGEAH